MWSRLTYVQKNKLLLPVFVVVLLLCWFFAFNKTFEAIRLNGKLETESENRDDLSFNPLYTRRKLAALNAILKGYKVAGQWNDKLWMQSSAIAAKYGVSLDYTLNKPLGDADSTLASRSQSLYFYGRYVQLVKLIDTLEGLPGNGKIAALEIKAPKRDAIEGQNAKCALRVDFRGMIK